MQLCVLHLLFCHTLSFVHLFEKKTYESCDLMSSGASMHPGKEGCIVAAFSSAVIDWKTKLFSEDNL